MVFSCVCGALLGILWRASKSFTIHWLLFTKKPHTHLYKKGFLECVCYIVYGSMSRHTQKVSDLY